MTETEYQAKRDELLGAASKGVSAKFMSGGEGIIVGLLTMILDELHTMNQREDSKIGLDTSGPREL